MEDVCWGETQPKPHMSATMGLLLARSEDRCLEKHPHGDVAHAVGLPLGLHIILLDARIKGERWKAPAVGTSYPRGWRLWGAAAYALD